MAKKTETSKKYAQTEKIEREYIIPLREKCRVVPRYKKTNKAVKTIKEFLARHMKIRDRDLNKIKIDKYLNEFLWFRGIKNPPSKIKVKVIKETDKDKKEIIKAELAEFPEKLKFKKAREEKRELKGTEAADKKKAVKKTEEEKTKEPETEKTAKEKEEKTEETAEEKEDKTKEEKEKKAAVVEAGMQMEKAAAKQTKHQAKEKVKQPKHQVRKALKK